jgi:HK97 gp10 family phage protein
MAEVDTELNWFGDDVIKNVNSGTIKALIRSGTIVKNEAKLLVPVDTSNLRGSIVKALNKTALTETVSTNVEYARYVEFGLRSNPNYPRQPFMRPALSNNIKNIEKIFIDEENKALDK